MIQGADSPLILCTVINKYMKISEIIDAIDSEIVARGLYIIEVTVSKDNDVEVTIESEEGKVELEDCVAISRFFETKFDRETEDYSLTVTSAGLDQPFKVLKQYIKAIGKKVEVQLKGGKKMVAVLEAADQESITLKYSQKEAVEGKKKKEKDCFISGKDENSLVLENDLIRYEFTMDGTLKSAFDKEEKRELLSSPGNILSLYHDHPNSYEAWDIDLYYPQELVEVLKAKQVRKITGGKLRSILELTFATENSVINQKVILESNSKKLDFVTEVDWYEARKMLRTAFPVDILANEAQYDIQYGYVKRSTADNTSWDIARFEACGHKYADLSSDRYGVALLNDCKYGYGIQTGLPVPNCKI